MTQNGVWSVPPYDWVEEELRREEAIAQQRAKKWNAIAFLVFPVFAIVIPFVVAIAVEVVHHPYPISPLHNLLAIAGALGGLGTAVLAFLTYLTQWLISTQRIDKFFVVLESWRLIAIFSLPILAIEGALVAWFSQWVGLLL